MEQNNKKYYITLIVVSILSLFVLLSFADDSRVAFSCSINNIEYKDVNPNNCWIKDINATYCPMPHDISCNGEVSELGNLIINIFRGL